MKYLFCAILGLFLAGVAGCKGSKMPLLVLDTIYTHTIRVDSTFKISKDTVIIRNDRVTQKIFIYDSTVYAECEAKGDTIYTEKIIPAPVVYVDKDLPVWVWMVLGAAGTLLVLLFFVLKYKLRG